MLTVMRYKAVVDLGCVLLIAVTAACGGSQPLPDIDATVEARVEVAKASLVAPTAAPLSTYTPLPTLTLTPAPVVEAKEAQVAVVVEVRRTL